MVLTQTATADISNTVTDQIQGVRMLLRYGDPKNLYHWGLSKEIKPEKGRRVINKFGDIWIRETQDTTDNIDHNRHHAQRGERHEH